ncbi:unnamed protein product [Urochloa humidicola]
MTDNDPQPSVVTRVEGSQAGYRHHLSFAGGRAELSVGNYPLRRDGCLILPFGDRFVLDVFRDGEGNFFTGHPQLQEPYTRREDIFHAASLLFRDRTQRPVVVQGRRPNRPRGARPGPPLGQVRYGTRALRHRSSRTRRAPSPAVAEDLRPSPLPSDKLVAAAAQSISALTLQEPDVSFLGDVHDTTSSEKLITLSAQTVPHNTTDGTPPLERCYSASSGPTIWCRSPQDWYFMFLIRMDRGGSFHMYPDLGGPFQSLKDVEVTIEHHLDKLQRQSKVCSEQDDISFMERLVRRCVFYPDGTPKRGPNSIARKNPNFQQRHFVQAILDQYNDDHNLLGDLAHELIGDVTFQWISEDTRSYYHFNFTTKVKEAGDVYGSAGNIFFAEVIRMERDGDWVLSCCCMIEPNDDGLCYGCASERPDIKHPQNTDAYTGGHVDEYKGFGGVPFSDSDDDVR